MSASCRTISFSFEAVRGEYLSRTQSATQRAAILSILCKWKYTVSRTYTTLYIYIDAADARFVSVGLAQARPNEYIYKT